MKFWHVLVGILVIVGLYALSFVFRGAETVSDMADKTVFNASRNVWSFETFHKNWNDYERYKAQYEQASNRVQKMEKDGRTTSQRYDNLVMEMDGSRQMANKIVAEYNKMSEIWYQDIWKSKGLPDSLTYLE